MKAAPIADAKVPMKLVRQSQHKRKSISKMALKFAKVNQKAKDVAEEPKIDAVKKVVRNDKKGARKPHETKVDSEEQIQSARTKELKAMGVADLKALLESKDLPAGRKEDMITTLLKTEAKTRAEVRAHEAKVKAVVDEIKKGLEAKSNPEVKELCATKGLKVGGDKNERIRRLLEFSKESGEIEKIMAQKARNARREVLSAMEKSALVKHCEKAKIDPLVHEFMVERLFSHEVATGSIRVQTMEEGGEKVDKAKLEKKMSKFKAMDVGELKKLAEDNGIEAGKKDVMIQALLAHAATTEAVAERKKELKALGKDGLRELVASSCLPTGNTQMMIESLLERDAKLRESAQKQKALEKEVETKKMEELSSKSATELKELCNEKGLKSGGGKNERVERLLTAAREAGEIDEVLVGMVRADRREELRKLDKVSLKMFCDKAGIDTILKEVLVERVVACEFDVPPAKKPRAA